MSELKLLGEGESNRETIYELIEKSSFLADLEADEIEKLAQWMKAYSASMGTYILREGDENACLCIIVEGEIDIFKGATSDKHIKIASIPAGGTIGEMGVVDGEALSATAIASKDSVVLILSRTEFQNLVKSNDRLGIKLLWKLAKIISTRLRKTTGRLADTLETINK